MNFVFEKGMVKMKKDIKKYEPPSMKVYSFTDQDKVLTGSGGVMPSESTAASESTTETTKAEETTTAAPDPTPDYAANALNKFMGGTNTTIEKK